MNEPIDWERVAQQLGTLTPDGERGSSDDALRAIELLIGEDRLRAAVDYYIAGGRGRELARCVLWQIHPWSAMRRCYEIYRSEADADDRVSAIELLRVVADRRALPWVADFLADPNPGVQAWGAGLLDQLLWSRLVEAEECEDLLRTAEGHPNDAVREKGKLVRGYLRARER